MDVGWMLHGFLMDLGIPSRPFFHSMGNYAVMNFLFANTSLTARTKSTTLLGPKAIAKFVLGNLSVRDLLCSKLYADFFALWFWNVGCAINGTHCSGLGLWDAPLTGLIAAVLECGMRH